MACGAPTNDDRPCGQPEGWGTDFETGPCKHHRNDDGGQPGPSDRQRDREASDKRPYGELQITRIVDALEDGATYEIAARAAGVSPRTFRRWRNRFDDLRERVERAEAESAGEALGIVQQAAESGDWRAASWLLENRHGYAQKDSDVPSDEVRKFVDTVQRVIRDTLEEETARKLILAIGDALEEDCDG